MRLPRYGYAFARNDRAVWVYDWLVACKRAAFRFREIATSLRLTLEMTMRSFGFIMSFWLNIIELILTLHTVLIMSFRPE